MSWCRLAEHEPDLVLHGHAHGGTFHGAIGTVPVYNVSVPVIGRDFWVFELDVGARAARRSTERVRTGPGGPTDAGREPSPYYEYMPSNRSW